MSPKFHIPLSSAYPSNPFLKGKPIPRHRRCGQILLQEAGGVRRQIQILCAAQKIVTISNFLLPFALYFLTVPLAKANPPESSRIMDSITVYIFLHESCIISQYYTLPLREIYEEYAGDRIQFVGLFPNFSSKPDKIQAFKERYKIPFTLEADYYHTRKEALGAEVTPEVVVVNECSGETLYKGRIDDAYARVGKRKRVTSTSELQDALEAIRNDQPIPVAHTEAIGCFIGKSKL